MNVQDMKNKILNFIRLNGPILPVQINKITEKDTIFNGALLSEMIMNQLIKISYGKIGGSPVYYAPGQESKLQILYSHLQQKEKEAYDLLRSRRILRDKELEPAIRVALRNIKDFAISLNVNVHNTIEIFWKWYLTTNYEAEELLKPLLEKLKPIEIPQPVLVPKTELPKEKIVIKEEKPAIKEPIKEKRKETKKIKDDLFKKTVENYIAQKKINIIAEELKRGKEIEMTVEIPSELGSLKFLLIAKDKKKISEADLSLAYSKGQSQKLPILFLSNSELTKKSLNYIEKNLKGLLVFKKI